MSSLRIFAVAIIATLALACGDDEHEDDHDEYTSYAECFPGELEHHGTAEAAFVSCDAEFGAPTSAEECNGYYATMDIPTTDISAHCNELFPPAT